MINKLRNFIIVIPLHVALNYPCDYLDQTAKILAKNNLVIFFDFQNPTLWKETLRSLKAISNYFISIINGRVGEELYFRPFSFFPTRNSATIFRINRFLGLIQLRLLLYLKRKKVIIWGFDPIIEQVVGKLGEKFSIYDCVDYLGEDQPTSESKTPEKKLFKKASFIAFNSAGLALAKESVNKYIRDKSIVTTCGCSYRLFFKKSKKKPADLQKIKGTKIILTAIFDYRLDCQLIDYLTNKNPTYNFILIGPFLKNVNPQFFTLIKKKNIFYLGQKAKKDLPDYYKNSDLGIIPYKTSLNFVKYSNPMKAYEYLASGIPVVSTGIEALKAYAKEIVYTTDSHQEFSTQIRKMLENWNSNKKTKAQAIAKLNSWENKVSGIERFILNQKNSL